MTIDCLVLGAGQEVGKSCAVVAVNGKRIMFDCGMHMGRYDRTRYPDFSRISSGGGFDGVIDCIIITHFHLDHVGALPYFTEVCGYNGPIYMTYPTKALAPFMLEDYRKVMERRGEEKQFTSEQIANCMRKVIAVDLKQTIQVNENLQIRAYYAGHVIGAAMFYAKVGDASLVYTGDYNMTPDRHLGAAQIDRLQLDLLITESTYATTIRDSKYAREMEFLQAVHKCVAGGGKVLIPTFALGRAQEICILLDDYWERMNIKVPIYFGAGLTIQANMYYKMLINWTSQKVKEAHVTRNPFDFKNVENFERSMISNPGPCVLFATPGMISGGLSLDVFKEWAPSEKNLIAMPGYCMAGTIGHKLMSGKPTTIDLDKETRIAVRCQVHQLAFSAHTDSKGIMDLVKFLSPKHVVLVHGEKPKMATLKAKIENELGMPCYYPCNNETVSVPSTQHMKADASDAFLRACSSPNFEFSKRCRTERDSSGFDYPNSSLSMHVSDERVSHGILVMEGNKKVKVIHQDELHLLLGKEKHDIDFAYCLPANSSLLQKAEKEGTGLPPATMTSSDMHQVLCSQLSSKLQEESIKNSEEHIRVESVHIKVCLNDNCPHRIRGCAGDNEPTEVFFCCRWSTEDEELAWKIITIMEEPLHPPNSE